jgi:hypothetical protein
VAKLAGGRSEAFYETALFYALLATIGDNQSNYTADPGDDSQGKLRQILGLDIFVTDRKKLPQNQVSRKGNHNSTGNRRSDGGPELRTPDDTRQPAWQRKQHSSPKD